jgi:aryl-alcohol dehydrogenase
VKITGAVVERADGPFELVDLDLDEPGPDEVVVRVAAAGVCQSDLVWVNARASEYPVLLGHEGAGTVQAIGATVTSVAPGDRVVMSFASCGTCTRCRGGRPAYCRDFRRQNFGGSRPDGSATVRRHGAPVRAHFFGQSSFATHALCREGNVVPIDDDVPFEIAAPMGCGVQTGAGAVLNTLRPRPGESFVVFGAGSVGLSALLAARAAGAGPIAVVEPHRARRELACKLGAVAAIDPSAGPVADSVRGVLPDGFACALDTSGVRGVIRTAFESLAPEGRLALVTTGGNSDAEIEVPISRLIEGRRIQGLIEGEAVPAEFIARMTRMWRQGIFPVDELCHGFGFAEINEAVAAMRDGWVVKPILLP